MKAWHPASCCITNHSKPLKGSRVHVLGVAYKRDIDDVRESPALDIIHLLGRRGAKVTYSDPFIPRLRADGVVPDMEGTDPEKSAEADCVVIVTRSQGIQLCSHRGVRAAGGGHA